MLCFKAETLPNCYVLQPKPSHSASSVLWGNGSYTNIIIIFTSYQPKAPRLTNCGAFNYILRLLQLLHCTGRTSYFEGDPSGSVASGKISQSPRSIWIVIQSNLSQAWDQPMEQVCQLRGTWRKRLRLNDATVFTHFYLFLRLFQLYDKSFAAAAHYLWPQPMNHVTKGQQREVPAWLFDLNPCVHLVDLFVCVWQHRNVERSFSKNNWIQTTDARVRERVYLLCCITVNHVRNERDLPIQEGGRSQVQWNLVCHHHCDVHSWRNSLNCPTWESTETQRMRNTGRQCSVTHTHSDSKTFPHCVITWAAQKPFT